jgi:hypothetical protein
MTAEELIRQFNTVFGTKEWPKIWEVDPATYGHCCQYVFNRLNYDPDGNMFGTIEVSIGNTHNGLMFKNVELILKP